MFPGSRRKTGSRCCRPTPPGIRRQPHTPRSAPSLRRTPALAPRSPRSPDTGHTPARQDRRAACPRCTAPNPGTGWCTRCYSGHRRALPRRSPHPASTERTGFSRACLDRACRTAHLRDNRRPKGTRYNPRSPDRRLALRRRNSSRSRCTAPRSPRSIHRQLPTRPRVHLHRGPAWAARLEKSSSHRPRAAPRPRKTAAPCRTRQTHRQERTQRRPVGTKPRRMIITAQSPNAFPPHRCPLGNGEMRSRTECATWGPRAVTAHILQCAGPGLASGTDDSGLDAPAAARHHCRSSCPPGCALLRRPWREGEAFDRGACRRDVLPCSDDPA